MYQMWTRANALLTNMLVVAAILAALTSITGALLFDKPSTVACSLTPGFRAQRTCIPFHL